ncbi:hypothetical protein EYC54_03750 [Xanthomonas oryzae]|nr:hypothetical protein EYC54_03750 [Xanthomonas oryzae]
MRVGAPSAHDGAALDVVIHVGFDGLRLRLRNARQEASHPVAARAVLLCVRSMAAHRTMTRCHACERARCGMDHPTTWMLSAWPTRS